MNEGSFDADMEALRKEFEEVAVERMAALADAMRAFAAAETPPARDAALREMENTAHKLGGSGALFGFPALGDAAQAFERVCQEMQADLGKDKGALERAWAELENAAKSG